MDCLTKEQRRRNMQAIRAAGTKIEVMLAKALWHKGYRYRKNYKKLYGKPDIVLTKYQIAIFCDSEFWHGKLPDKHEQRIGTNRQFWIKKLQQNRERDRLVTQRLGADGWTVLRFWADNIQHNLGECVAEIEKVISENVLKDKMKDIQP